MNATQLKQLVIHSINNKLPLLIKGAPGIGKSDIIEQATNEVGADLIISHPVVSDPTDYKGLPFASNGEAHFLPFGELNSLIKADKPLVFFLDDLGQAPPSVQAACMQLILARRINGHKVSEHVTFIAATNRKSDLAGVAGLLEPVKSRFVSIVELSVDVDAWVQWALNNNMPVELIAFIRFKPELLSKFTPSKEIVNSPCPRTIANVGKLQNSGLPESLYSEVFTGSAGDEFSVMYIGFLNLFKNMPSIDQIVLNPEKTPMPDEPSVLYGLSGAIAHRMEATNIDQLVKFVERMPGEFGVMIFKDIANNKKKEHLIQTKAAIRWATSNGKKLGI